MEGVTAYHYTSQSNWHLFDIGNRGLHPRSSLLFTDIQGVAEETEFASQKYIFALLEPEPESWRGNEEFLFLWQRLLDHVGHGDFIIMRCSFDLTRNDSAFVLDWAHMERVREEIRRYQAYGATGPEVDRIIQANQKYIDSAVRLPDYRRGHTLPELIIGNPIPASRFREAAVYVGA